jgi:hypothetical protein
MATSEGKFQDSIFNGYRDNIFFLKAELKLFFCHQSDRTKNIGNIIYIMVVFFFENYRNYIGKLVDQLGSCRFTFKLLFSIFLNGIKDRWAVIVIPVLKHHIRQEAKLALYNFSALACKFCGRENRRRFFRSKSHKHNLLKIALNVNKNTAATQYAASLQGETLCF